MLSDKARFWTKGIVTFIALGLAKLGFTPNILTITGCLLNIIVAYLLMKGMFIVGAIALIFITLFDAFDGALARATDKVTKFGAFLDSTLDRYSEAIIFFGLLWYYLSQDASKWYVLLIYITIFGSITTSYVRARAEGTGFECKIGIFTRFERFLVIILGLLTRKIFIMLIIMAVFSNITAIQRIIYVYRKNLKK